MQKSAIYEEISIRTGGDIYIGKYGIIWLSQEKT